MREIEIVPRSFHAEVQQRLGAFGSRLDSGLYMQHHHTVLLRMLLVLGLMLMRLML